VFSLSLTFFHFLHFENFVFDLLVDLSIYIFIDLKCNLFHFRALPEERELLTLNQARKQEIRLRAEAERPALAPEGYHRFPPLFFHSIPFRSTLFHFIAFFNSFLFVSFRNYSTKSN
jgi:hypothetical protein